MTDIVVKHTWLVKLWQRDSACLRTHVDTCREKVSPVFFVEWGAKYGKIKGGAAAGMARPRGRGTR